MKDWKLVLIAFSPMFIGIFYRVGVQLPFDGDVILYAVPLIMLFYWFWAGMAFSRAVKGTFRAVLYGNAAGFVSVLLYIWQVVILPEGERSPLLAGISGLFTASTELFSMRLANILEPVPGEPTLVTQFGAMLIGFSFLLVCFVEGHLRGKAPKEDETGNGRAGR